MDKIIRVALIVIFLASCQAAPVVPPTPTPEPTLAPTPEPTATPDPDSDKYAYSGKVGEYTMTIICEGKGKPTIILENGSDTLSWSYPKYSKIAQTCFYPRVGMLSDKPKSVRTIMDQVKELHTLLQQARLKGPFILVGHSIAGNNMLLFTDLYPDEVAGLVCVDCRHPMVDIYFIEKIKKEYASDPMLEKIVQDAVINYYLWGIDPAATVLGKEMINPSATAKQVLNITNVGNRPFVVLNASDQMFSKKHENKAKNDILFNEAWEMTGIYLSKLSTQGRTEVVPNSTHSNLPMNDAVEKAIQEVYDKVKK
jgi:pimeloyl-ACP methyl ester carboxylesterase